MLGHLIPHDNHIKNIIKRKIEWIRGKGRPRRAFMDQAKDKVAYAIGVAEPLSITVFDYGTSHKTQQELLRIVQNNFDLRPGKIVKELNLRAPIYQKTSTYGHFGREGFPWENPKPLVVE